MEIFKFMFAITILMSSVCVKNYGSIFCHAVDEKEYWENVFGTLPMPEAIVESLGKQGNGGTYIDGHAQLSIGGNNLDDSIGNYGIALNTKVTPEQYTGFLLFLKKDMYLGNNITMNFKYHLNHCKDDPVKGNGSHPKPPPSSFSSSNLSELVQLQSVKPGEFTQTTLARCEKFKSINGANQFCATSLQGLVNSVISHLDTQPKDVRVISAPRGSDVPSDPSNNYQLLGIRQLAERKHFLACHKLKLPYAVFYCHQPDHTEVYSLSIVGVQDRVVSKSNIHALCHTNTSGWNPLHASFQLLKVKPGTAICHFLQKSDLVWYSIN